MTITEFLPSISRPHLPSQYNAVHFIISFTYCHDIMSRASPTVVVIIS
uniref:Uncharacterized protein n=1 Tax=Anguilla anguilla TaxID=7936 RepID=A0A0E9WCC4_ANGAN